MAIIHQQQADEYDYYLSHCIEIGENEEAKSMLEDFVNPAGIVYDGGLTLLHIAVIYDNKEMAEHLTKLGCDIETVDMLGLSPLAIAAEKSNWLMVSILIEYNWKDVSDQKWLDCFEPMMNESIHHLLSLGCSDDFDYCQKFFDALSKKVAAQKREIIGFLKSADHLTKLAAAVFGDENLCRFIVLTTDYNVDYCEKYTGGTALHCAIKKGHILNAKLLIKYKASLDIVDRYKNSGLHYYPLRCQSRDESSQLLKDIISKSNTILTSTELGRATDFERLLVKGSPETVALLLTRDIRLNTDLTVSFLNLIGAKNRSEEQDKIVMDIVSRLSENECDGAIEVLDVLGIDFEVNTQIANGDNFLIEAIKRLRVGHVQFLLKHGADVNLTNEIFGPPLEYACAGIITPAIALEKKLIRIVELLLEEGADGQYVCGNGESILKKLQLADEKDEMLKTLAAHFALRQTRNHESLTARTRDEIALHLKTKVLFHSYEKQLEDMKKDRISQTATLYKLLTANYNQLKVCARDTTLTLKHVKAITTQYDSYFRNILIGRLAKAKARVNIEQQAITAIASLMGLCQIGHYSIVCAIVALLSDKDLLALSKASQP